MGKCFLYGTLSLLGGKVDYMHKTIVAPHPPQSWKLILALGDIRCLRWRIEAGVLAHKNGEEGMDWPVPVQVVPYSFEDRPVQNLPS